jgi:hypothetical protein
MDSLAYMPHYPSEEMTEESKKALRASGIHAEETISFMVARMLDGIRNINETKSWVPRGKLIEGARDMAAYLAIEEGRELGKQILNENPEIGRLAKRVASESERNIEETISRLEKTDGSEALINIIREQRNSDDTFWFSSALFRLFFHIGTQACAFWEKVPPLNQPFELTRGMGIAAEIRITEDLDEETYYLFSEWDDRLREMHEWIDRPEDLISSITEEILENEIDYLFQETELYDSIISWSEEEGESVEVLATQLALRLHKRAYPAESPLPDIF